MGGDGHTHHWAYLRVSGNPTSIRRIVSYLAVGAAIAIILLLVLIDPTLQLVAGFGAIAVFGAAFITFWRKRHRFLVWFRNFPPMVRGLITGCIVWIFCSAWFYALETQLIQLPSSPFGLFNSTCAVLAVPISLGGYFFVWGDNGPPSKLFESVLFNVLCGVILNSSLGAVAFVLVDRFNKMRSIGNRGRPNKSLPQGPLRGTPPDFDSGEPEQ